MTARLSAQDAVRIYFHAKDENRPHLMARAFAETASLEMRVHTQNIAFPAISRGLDEITEVLVRTFGRSYENVYTFCLDPLPDTPVLALSCRWLVGMSDKANGNVRVGCGGYDWTFDAQSGLVQHLVIAIDAMEILPPSQSPAVMAWLEAAGYPWTSARAVRANAPAIDALAPVLRALDAPA